MLYEKLFQQPYMISMTTLVPEKVPASNYSMLAAYSNSQNRNLSMPDFLLSCGVGVSCHVGLKV